MQKFWAGIIIGTSTVLVLAGCSSGSKDDEQQTPTATYAERVIFFDWEEDIPQSVIDAFTAEYGIEVVYEVYDSSETAVDALRAGGVYDLVVMESHFVPTLIAEGLLAKINYAHVPNFKNILPSFRDLVYDPGNVYSVPFNWGTTALVVRGDLVAEPVTSWNALWDERYAGQVGVWNLEREVIAFTLKALGYSANSEDPAELEAARAYLLELAPRVQFLEDYSDVTAAEPLSTGELVIAHGYAYDVLEGRALNPAIEYVLPEEGALLWGDNFVIPATSAHQATAELFLDFLLRPEIAAQIANENVYATANEAALPMIDEELRNDPVIFPPNEQVAQAEMLLPLSAEAEALYMSIWDEFVAAVEAAPTPTDE